jgi:DNA mismatch repair protein MutH
MTAARIIDEIKHLTEEEQSAVIQFVRELDRAQQLNGSELAELAKRMVYSTDPAEVERLKDEITRGFYGDKHA